MRMTLSLSRRLTSWPVCAGLVVYALALPACSSSTPQTASSPAPATVPVPATPPVLWGDMKSVVSVKELMRYMLDPVSDNIFNAVSTVITKKGVVDTKPTTDADWERIQIGAVSLAEGAYLLKVPRPFAPPGEPADSESSAVELTPAQMTAKVERDPVEWNARIETLRNAALAVMDIVKKKDVDALWDAGEILDQACENCHRSYWYPGENAEFYQKLRGRLDQYRRLRADRNAKPQK
jgi:cytochrome c556